MEEVGIEMREGRKRRKVKESVGRCEGERRVTTRQAMAGRGEGPREGRERVVVRGIVSGSHLAFKSEKGRLKAYGHGRRVYEAGHGFQPQKHRCTAGVTPSPQLAEHSGFDVTRTFNQRTTVPHIRGYHW